MRLLHIICSTDAEAGGPVEALRRISGVLMADGNEVQAVSLESAEDIAARNHRFPLIGLGRGIGKPRVNLALTRWLRKNAANFDVVILHGLWNFTSAGSWLALRKLPVPYFVFSHGMLDPWFRERYPLKHVLKQIYWFLFEGRVLHDAQSVLFTCEEERLRARRVFLGHSYRECVLPYGTGDPEGDAEDQKAAFARAFPKLKGRRYLLFLSRIHPKKGIDLLIQAFADCIHGIPGDLDVVIAGPDQVGSASRLQMTAQRLGVSDRIHWIGMLTGALKWGAFRSSEAMILPSHQENFGFVVPEAMACSTPVLISDKVNIWREVEECGAGFAEPDTREGTRRLIERFCAMSREERDRMSALARAGFLAKFDIQTTARVFARVVLPVPEKQAVAIIEESNATTGISR